MPLFSESEKCSSFEKPGDANWSGLFAESRALRRAAPAYLSRLRGRTPGDSEAGTVSVSVTGVVAVVVSSRELLMKDVVLEAEGLVVTGVWACWAGSLSSAC